MPGTLVQGAMLRIFSYALKIFGPLPFVFMDLGADSGEILVKAMAMGAAFAVGIEQNSSSNFLWDSFFVSKNVKTKCSAEVINNLHRSTTCIFGTDVKDLALLPHPPSHCAEHLFIFMLCDGWHGDDMEHALKLVGRSTKAVLLVCCCPQRSGHIYRYAFDVLSTLNKESRSANIPEDQDFQHTGRFSRTTMAASSCTLNVHAFVRGGFSMKVSRHYSFYRQSTCTYLAHLRLPAVFNPPCLL